MFFMPFYPCRQMGRTCVVRERQCGARSFRSDSDRAKALTEGGVHAFTSPYHP